MTELLNYWGETINLKHLAKYVTKSISTTIALTMFWWKCRFMWQMHLNLLRVCKASQNFLTLTLLLLETDGVAYNIISYLCNSDSHLSIGYIETPTLYALPKTKLKCLKQGTEVGLCTISGIHGKIYLFKSVLTCYICTV